MNKLEKYLAYQVIPQSVLDYEDNITNECPLCDEPHFEYERHVFRMEIDDEIELKSTYICEHCQFAIEEHGVYEEDKYWEDTPIALRTYLFSGEFPKNAHLWTRAPHLCIFCKNELDDVYLELELPVGNDMIGGKVYACDRCANKIGYVDRKHWTYTDNCRRCNDKYPITEDEYEERIKYDNLNQHFCNSCAFKEHGNFTIQERFRPAACSVCGGSVINDLMLLNRQQLEDPRCKDHYKLKYNPDVATEKYNIYICNDFKDSRYRGVITDRIDNIKISYEVQDKDYPMYYKVLNNELVLPNTIKHGDLIWRVRTKLEILKNEDKQSVT